MFQEPRTSTRPSTAKPKSFDFAWEKRHWILIIGISCLVFWWFAPQLNSTPFLQSSLKLLPLIGGLAFATETILKLAQ